MIKKITTSLSVFLLVTLSIEAQTFVSTTPSKKTAILEEFTGVKCGACPSGHAVVDGLVSTYGNDFIVIGLHPDNSSLTSPYSGDEDLRRSYLDVFYSNPYYGNGAGRAMPTGHVNRREYSGVRKLNTNLWSSKAAAIILEDSPLNIGVLSDLDTAMNSLEINIEVYYTDAMTNENLIHVYLIESDIYTQQSGGSANYQQNHVFREAIHTGQWGESIGTSFAMGELISKQYSFDLSQYNYDTEHCEIVVFVTDAVTQEIITGTETIADLTIPASIAEFKVNHSLLVYPNPSNTRVNLAWEVNSNSVSNISILNIQGQLVFTENVYNSNNLTIDISSFAKGLYSISVRNSDKLHLERLVVE